MDDLYPRIPPFKCSSNSTILKQQCRSRRSSPPCPHISGVGWPTCSRRVAGSRPGASDAADAQFDCRAGNSSTNRLFSIKAIGVRSRAGPPRVGRCLWLAGFLRGLPLPPPMHSGTAPYIIHPTSALKTIAIKSRPNIFTPLLINTNTIKQELGEESAMTFVKEPSQHLPEAISGNHGKPELARSYRGSNPSPPDCESNVLTLRHLAILNVVGIHVEFTVLQAIVEEINEHCESLAIIICGISTHRGSKGCCWHHLLAPSRRTLANLDVFLQFIALHKLHVSIAVMIHCLKRSFIEAVLSCL
ncbi:hypothetical protein PR048_028310 [Dryococelus australis]|uniref:Uncharacterized protein n=1 Tax=Dryococelus australis TaxID=614101 RepID=A0ABQ9GIX8_9NEOP|nr:hypothetical protein PR048_028310 [Dryococelus australis]